MKKIFLLVIVTLMSVSTEQSVLAFSDSFEGNSLDPSWIINSAHTRNVSYSFSSEQVKSGQTSLKVEFGQKK